MPSIQLKHSRLEIRRFYHNAALSLGGNITSNRANFNTPITVNKSPLHHFFHHTNNSTIQMKQPSSAINLYYHYHRNVSFESKQKLTTLAFEHPTKTI